jgi:hypothetical protein
MVGGIWFVCGSCLRVAFTPLAERVLRVERRTGALRRFPRPSRFAAALHRRPSAEPLPIHGTTLSAQQLQPAKSISFPNQRWRKLMLKTLATLLLFQCLGEFVSFILNISVPGPVI